jgi:DNA mismatch repair protein MutS
LHHEVREHSVREELTPGDANAPLQIKLFEPVEQGLADRIRSLNVNELRPVEAFEILQNLQQELLKR